MIRTNGINDAKIAGRVPAAPLRAEADPQKAFRLPTQEFSPLSDRDFLKPGQSMALPPVAALVPLKAADFASSPSHLMDEPSAMAPLNELDFIPGSRSPKKSQNDRLTTEAEKWVSQTFFGTLLKQSRNSPFKSELFNGGRGGDAFGSLMDQELADRMAQGAGKKLVDGIVRSIQAARAYEHQQPVRSPVEQGVQPPSEQKQTSPKDPTGYDYSKVRIHVAPALRG